MNESLNAISSIKLYHLLWEENALTGQPSRPQDYIAEINLSRAKAQLPLLSSMCSFNPEIPCYTTTPQNIAVARSLWQQGFIQFIKTQGAYGRDSMIGACQYLHVLPEDHLVRMTGYCISCLLILPNRTQYFNALCACFIRFEQILHQASEQILPVPAENVLRDILFYIDILSPLIPACIEDNFKLSQAWDETKPLQGLKNRVGYYAKKVMLALTVPDSDATIKKERLMVDITPVLDGVLFLQSYELRAQIEARYNKCPSRLLLISVPSQKLMAEFMRLAVYDRSPN